MTLAILNFLKFSILSQPPEEPDMLSSGILEEADLGAGN